MTSVKRPDLKAVLGLCNVYLLRDGQFLLGYLTHLAWVSNLEVPLPFPPPCTCGGWWA